MDLEKGFTARLLIARASLMIYQRSDAKEQQDIARKGKGVSQRAAAGKAEADTSRREPAI